MLQYNPMNHPVHECITGGTAVKIAACIEDGIRDGALRPGHRLPTVRALADRLEVSPATVAAAYAALKARGFIVSRGRRGTHVSHRPVHPSRRRQHAPLAARNLYDGNPDRALLPDMSRALAAIDPSPSLYGESPHYQPLVRLLARELAADGVAVGELCVVSGAMDGIGRVLAEHLRAGDRVAIEDPGFTGHLDLVTSRGLTLAPVPIDQEGMLADGLDRACAEGAAAVLVTPRVQSPTGAALTEQRADELRRVLRRHPDVLIIEDDHANRIADVPLFCLHDARRSRWAHLHSFSKSINPDLRMAMLTGDETTMARVQDRMLIEERWVSNILQRLTHSLLSDKAVRKHLKQVARTYTSRRQALLDGLDRAGLRAWGRSGYNVWLPVREETSTVQALADAGWAVSAGERFRLQSPPAVRITASTLEPKDGARLAEAAVQVLAPARHTATV